MSSGFHAFFQKKVFFCVEARFWLVFQAVVRIEKHVCFLLKRIQ